MVVITPLVAASLAARRQHTTRHDLTGPDGPPASALKRTPGRDRDVDLVLKEVARRLLGRLEHEPPPRGWQQTATLRRGRHDSDVYSDAADVTTATSTATSGGRHESSKHRQPSIARTGCIFCICRRRRARGAKVCCSGYPPSPRPCKGLTIDRTSCASSPCVRLRRVRCFRYALYTPCHVLSFRIPYILYSNQ